MAALEMGRTGEDLWRALVEDLSQVLRRPVGVTTPSGALLRAEGEGRPVVVDLRAPGAAGLGALLGEPSLDLIIGLAASTERARLAERRLLHDLRGALGVVQGSAELLEVSLPDGGSAKQRRALAAIQRQVEGIGDRIRRHRETLGP